MLAITPYRRTTMQYGEARRRVIVVHDECGWAGGHEAVTLESMAARLALLVPASARDDAYYVPARTLTREQASRLGIASADDLFGGVVPHAFAATKMISHALPGADSARPAGWADALGAALAGAVLPGFSAFAPEDAMRGGLQLLEDGGVRLKVGDGIGGNGQAVVGDAAALADAIARIGTATIEAAGVVLERNLEREATLSIGEIRIGTLRAAYHGRQRRTLDHAGRTVYGGSDLVVRRGGLADLQEHVRDPDLRLAIRQAQAYDEAAHAAFPGMYASRRNYDVSQGFDADGRRWSGVLEQSWRIGGASPAEIAALEALLADPRLEEVHASAIEAYGPPGDLPPGAVLHFHGTDPAVGRLVKYAMVHPHGHPAQ